MMSDLFYIENSWKEVWTGNSWGDLRTKNDNAAKLFTFESGKALLDKRFSKGVRRPKPTAPGGFIILNKPKLKRFDRAS